LIEVRILEGPPEWPGDLSGALFGQEEKLSGTGEASGQLPSGMAHVVVDLGAFARRFPKNSAGA